MVRIVKFYKNDRIDEVAFKKIDTRSASYISQNGKA